MLPLGLVRCQYKFCTPGGFTATTLWLFCCEKLPQETSDRDNRNRDEADERREAGQSSNSDPYSLLSPEGVTFEIDLLGQTCRRTGWEIHAYCLMDNHFHLLVEMPRSNLSVGMQWLLGSYTQRFNR